MIIVEIVKLVIISLESPVRPSFISAMKHSTRPQQERMTCVECRCSLSVYLCDLGLSEQQSSRARGPRQEEAGHDNEAELQQQALLPLLAGQGRLEQSRKKSAFVCALCFILLNIFYSGKLK